RRVTYNLPLHDLNEPSNVDNFTIRSTYLDFPLMLKYKSKRIINQRPYMLTGLAMRVDISKAEKAELLRLKKATFYAEAGMGWDIYLQFFRLSTELKYSFGINNSLTAPPVEPQPKYYNQAFKRLSSHMLTLSFHFE
ncbi:MAG TPA: outer membrane beta-barrel protein, partial [Prolixibacteraceae bacterium]|nr:outer membrane beta-barrel protein [Prolixibacteraceae bacterium]